MTNSEATNLEAMNSEAMSRAGDGVGVAQVAGRPALRKNLLTHYIWKIEAEAKIYYLNKVAQKRPPGNKS